LPKWIPGSFKGLSSAAQQEWDRFTREVRIHEANHVQHAFKKFLGLGNKLMGMTQQQAIQEIENVKIQYRDEEKSL
jgi:predicted secreted Zn-dependent protease